MTVEHLALDDRPHPQPAPPIITLQNELLGALRARVPHELQELVLAGDVSVERHRGESELLCYARHRHCLETLGVSDSDRGFHDRVDRQAGLGAARAAAAPAP